MKVSDLEGAELDKWVAKIEDIDLKSPLRQIAVKLGSISEYSPSTYWSQGGPLIEKYDVTLDEISPWGATSINGHRQYGPTPLIAAMRAIVASKYGEEVND